MIKIKAQDLKDFQTCELLHEYRNVKGLTNQEYLHPRFKKQKEYEATIKKIASFFFYKKQAFSEPSYQALLNRWQKLWYSADTTAMDIATNQHEIMWDNESSYTGQAAMALLEFYNEFADKQDEQVVLSDEKFSVPLSRSKTIVLEGVFDLIIRKKTQLSDTFIVYKWSGEHKRPPGNFWLFDFAMMDYAFRYRNDFRPIDVEYRLWDFGSAKPGSINYVVSENDLKIMKHWSEELARTDTFVPRRGLTSFCRSCPYDDPCSKWEFPKA